MVSESFLGATGDFHVNGFSMEFAFDSKMNDAIGRWIFTQAEANWKTSSLNFALTFFLWLFICEGFEFMYWINEIE